MPKKFPPEFKRDVVTVARRGDLTVPEVAVDFDISAESVRRWMRQADIDDGVKDGLTTAEQAELVQLRRDKRRLEMENEILRRAAAYFAKDDAPKMMYPLVRDLAADGIPGAVDLRGARLLDPGVLQVAGPTRVATATWHDAYLTNAHHRRPRRRSGVRLPVPGRRARTGRPSRSGSGGCGGCAAAADLVDHGPKRAAAAASKRRARRSMTTSCNATSPRRSPNVMWLTDITEHPTVEGKVYCCAIKDLFSNRIVGYAIGDRMTAELAVSALRAAIARRQPARHRRGSLPTAGRNFARTSLPGRARAARA